MISIKKLTILGAIAGTLGGLGMTCSAQAVQEQAPQQYYYGGPCMMDGFYNGAPVTSQYPVMMGFYCPYHGMYHFRPVYLPTQQQLQQQAPQFQPAPQTVVPDQSNQQGQPQSAPTQK